MMSQSHRGLGFNSATLQSVHLPRLTGDEHGSAERGRRHDRERDRPGRGPSPRGHSVPTFVRFNSVGEQETMDWLAALETVTN